MKKSMRAFGIGIFLTGAAIAGYNQFFPGEQTADTKALEKQLKEYAQQIEELQQQLEAEEDEPSEESGEQVAEASESAEPDKNPEAKPETETEAKTEPEQPSDDIVEATIYIYENVSLYTIGQQVEDLGIIKNGRELELYLAKPEYARFIQKGAFDLRSDMTIEQIAKLLTGKKAN